MANLNDLTEDQIFNMSDEEIEAAFHETKASMDSPDVGDEYDGNEMETSEEETYVEDEVEEYEEDEEVVDDELEQPVDDEDSESTGDEEDEESDEEVEEVEEDTDDGQSNEEETKPAEDEAETKKEVQPIPNHVFKANGKEYELSQEEMMKMFPKIFGQAMDYTKKMQSIKPWRKTIDAIEGAQLSHDDINLMIDVLKGDKGAINEVIKRTGIDTLELDAEENKYTPNDYGRNDSELAIKDVIDRISVDPVYTQTERILNKDWDDASINELVKDPSLIEALHVDVRNGTFAKLQPTVDMLKVADGGRKSDLEYYWEAAAVEEQKAQQANALQRQQEQLQAERVQLEAEKARIAEVKQKQAKQKVVAQESVKRKAAAPSKAGNVARKPVDYLDDSDEAFEDWYRKLEDKL